MAIPREIIPVDSPEIKAFVDRLVISVDNNLTNLNNRLTVIEENIQILADQAGVILKW